MHVAYVNNDVESNQNGYCSSKRYGGVGNIITR